MPRQSIVYEVLIASPSDLNEERDVLMEVVQDWNSGHSRSRNVELRAVRWEIDTSPAYGARPQELINKQLVENADILMAVFWTRLGTPTGQAPSGTAEEIERFRSEGKPVLLYFSERDIPHNHDPEQLRLLKEYRHSLASDTLYQTFRDVEDLRRRATRDLVRIINGLSASSLPVPQPTANKNGFARVSLMTQSQGLLPTTSVKVMRIFGTMENLSSSKRIREYSCTLSVPQCCLSFSSGAHMAEISSDQPGYRRFRYTEQNHTRVTIHPGDRFQIVSVDIAVGHLSGTDKEKCLKMDVIVNAEADGEALEMRKTVAELLGD